MAFAMDHEEEEIPVQALMIILLNLKTRKYC